MKIAILFPGQGSQYLGMAREFVESRTESSALMAMAEATCELPLGTLCAEGPMEQLTRAAALQPAITITNLICWEALQAELLEIAPVSCFAGHSLGEYSALCAAGVIGAEDALRLVARRGSLMEREGDRKPGGMRAVLGLEIAEVDSVIQAYSGPGVVTVANHNTPQQVVISGSIDGLDGVGPALEDKGGKLIALNVSVANHSPLVAQAVPDFKEFIATIPFAAPKVPVYFNVSSGKEDNPANIKEMMAGQIASKVRWYEIIMAMLADGVDTFIEVGPKNVLKGMMKKIVPKGTSVTSLNLDSPDTLAQCVEKLRSLS